MEILQLLEKFHTGKNAVNTSQGEPRFLSESSQYVFQIEFWFFRHKLNWEIVRVNLAKNKIRRKKSRLDGMYFINW